MTIDQERLWNSRAGLGATSGTRDLIAVELERRAIEQYVKDGMRVLDVGCGDGATLMRLAKNHSGEFLGIDPAEDMVKAALETNLKEQYGPGRIWFEVGNALTWEPRTTYDLILTQRCLINLGTAERQQTAIRRILSWLRPGGKYLMVECIEEGLAEINALRALLALPSIQPPPHNAYLRLNDVTRLARDLHPAVTMTMERYSRLYYLLSRCINAKMAADAGTDPDYDSAVNRAALLLPASVCNLLGQGVMFVWRKAE